MSENAAKSTFNAKVVEELLKQSFRNKGKTSIDPVALNLIVELGKLYVQEGFARAAIQAEKENDKVVKTEHLEKVLAQLLLDF